MANIRRGMMAAAGSAGGVSEYQLWVWGSSGEGCLGDGSEVHKSSPVQVGDNFFGEIDVADEGIIVTGNRMFISYASSSAVKGDGTLWTWGLNTLGKLGVGDTTNRSSPVQVGSLTDWKSTCMTQDAMCASKTDGTLWGWGKGDQPATYPECSGQDITVCSPVQIGSATDWSGVFSLNARYSKSVLGLRTTGQVYMWGHFTNAHWTQGGFPYSPSEAPFSNVIYSRDPVAIDDKNYVMAGCGWDNVWAIENTGKLWAWGMNHSGPLGTGNETDYSSPVQIGSATDWGSWTSGSYGTESLFASKTNGEIWACGENKGALFGLENTTAYTSPVQVGGPGDWQTGGHGLTQASLQDITDVNGDNTGGALWVCGTNDKGQLGLGNTTNISSPVQLGSDTTWIATTKQGGYGSEYVLAIKKAS